MKAGGPLGLSIVGGIDHASHPFGNNEPGVFISKIVPGGTASQTSLRIGDRILTVNGRDISGSTHEEAVKTLIEPSYQILLKIRHDPPPAGLQELVIERESKEKIGMTIKGGAGGAPGNPFDPTDEGVFISKINSSGAVARDGNLKVGKRLLEVNGQSMLGATHQEAVRALRQAGYKMQVMVCNGYTQGTDSPALSKSMSSLDREDDDYLRIQQENEALREQQEFEEEFERAKREQQERSIRREQEAVKQMEIQLRNNAEERRRQEEQARQLEFKRHQEEAQRRAEALKRKEEELILAAERQAAEKLAQQEAAAAEAERQRLERKAQQEAEAERERQRVEAEQERQRLEAEREKQRLQAELERQRVEAERERQREEAERERLRLAQLARERQEEEEKKKAAELAMKQRQELEEQKQLENTRRLALETAAAEPEEDEPRAYMNLSVTSSSHKSIPLSAQFPAPPEPLPLDSSNAATAADTDAIPFAEDSSSDDETNITSAFAFGSNVKPSPSMDSKIPVAAQRNSKPPTTPSSAPPQKPPIAAKPTIALKTGPSAIKSGIPVAAGTAPTSSVASPSAGSTKTGERPDPKKARSSFFDSSAAAPPANNPWSKYDRKKSPGASNEILTYGQVRAQQAEERARQRQERLAEIEKDAKRAHAMTSQGMTDGLSGPNGSIHQGGTGPAAAKARFQ